MEIAAKRYLNTILCGLEVRPGWGSPCIIAPAHAWRIASALAQAYTACTSSEDIAIMTHSRHFDIWPGIARLYQDAAEASGRHFVLSSASIIQEHTMRAFMEASRSCAEALAKNAMSVQQQSIGRFMTANQKVVDMMGQAWVQAWTRGWQPLK
jgi:hypothetical protein